MAQGLTICKYTVKLKCVSCSVSPLSLRVVKEEQSVNTSLSQVDDLSSLALAEM